MRKIALLPLGIALAGALALSACNSSPPEKLPEGNDVVAENVSDNVETPVAPPATNVTNTTVTAAPAPGFTDDAQMRDDADASGMTARLPDETVPTANQTKPAE